MAGDLRIAHARPAVEQVDLAAARRQGADGIPDQIQLLPISQQPAAWNALEKQIMTKDFPLIPTYYPRVLMAHGDSIKGDNIDNTFGMPTWKDMYVSK